MRARILLSLTAALTAASTATAQTSVRTLMLSDAGGLYPEGYYFGAESPNKRYVVLGGEDSFIRFDRQAREWRKVTGAPVGNFVRWSPNGRFIASAYRGGAPSRTIWILPIDTVTGLPGGAARRITMREGAYPAWSPDSRRIAFASVDSGKVRIVVTPFNGGDEEVVYDARGQGGNIAWSRDGERLIFHTSTPGAASAWHSVDLRTKQMTSFEGGPARMIGFTPDGKRIARFAQPTGVLEIATTDGRTLQQFMAPRRAIPFAWSTTNPNEFSATQQVILQHLERAPVAGGSVMSVTPLDSQPISGVRFSPDGHQMAFWRSTHEGTSRLHVANADASGARAVGDSEGGIATLDWSPSGRQIAYVVDVPTTALRVVDLQSGKSRDLVRPKDGAAVGTGIKWRADGQTVRYILRPKGFAATSREVHEIGLDGQDKFLVTADEPNPSSQSSQQPIFANDTLLFLKSLARGVETVHLRTGARRAVFAGRTTPGNTYGMGVSPDGAWTAFAVWDGNTTVINLFSLRTGESRRVPNALGGQLGELFFLADGRNLVADVCISCKQDIEKFEVAVFPMNGDAPRVLTSSQPTYRGFSDVVPMPDGKSVLFVGEQSWNTRIVTLTMPKP